LDKQTIKNDINIKIAKPLIFNPHNIIQQSGGFSFQTYEIAVSEINLTHKGCVTPFQRDFASNLETAA
jgi:hypothetical protein